MLVVPVASMHVNLLLGFGKNVDKWRDIKDGDGEYIRISMMSIRLLDVDS